MSCQGLHLAVAAISDMDGLVALHVTPSWLARSAKLRSITGRSRRKCQELTEADRSMQQASASNLCVSVSPDLTHVFHAHVLQSHQATCRERSEPRPPSRAIRGLGLSSDLVSFLNRITDSDLVFFSLRIFNWLPPPSLPPAAALRSSLLSYFPPIFTTQATSRHSLLEAISTSAQSTSIQAIHRQGGTHPYPS